MTVAYLFPGQGSQRAGMGRAFYREWPETERTFDDLDAATDLDLWDLCFEAETDTLRRTEYTQPAVYATSLAAYAGLVERVGEPDYVSGHSLGHISAVTAAGALDPSEGLNLIRRRGQLMQSAAERDGPGVMAAALLVDGTVVQEVCADHEGVAVAAFNAPRQTVISGQREAVDDAKAALEGQTSVRFLDLDVGAAFHSPVMRSATAEFGEVLADVGFDELAVPVGSDLSGEVHTDPQQVRAELAAQLTSPVDWVSAVQVLERAGVDTFVELPPTGTLAGFVERIAPEATAIELESPAEIERLS